MADISIIGVVDKIRFMPSIGGGTINVTEMKKGYKKANGEYVQDQYFTWRCYFKKGQYNFIDTHFDNGMLVHIKGQIQPHATDTGVDGESFTVLIDSISLFSTPRIYGRKEQKMMKESQRASTDTPNLKQFNEPDF